MGRPVCKTARWRTKTEIQPIPPPSSSQPSTQKTKSGYTIYISDDDTPPPERQPGADNLKGKGKEVIHIASSSDYGGSSDNEALIAASQEVGVTHSSQVHVQGPKESVARGSSTSYGGSSDNEELIAASQEVELMHSSQKQVQTHGRKAVVARGSSTSYGGSSDNGDLVAAAEQIELMRSWVDAGIQMAIEEARIEAEGGDLGFGREKDGFAGSPAMSLVAEKGLMQTPVSQTFGQNAPYATPSRIQNGPIPYCNPGIPQYQDQPAFPGQQYTPGASVSPQIHGYYTPQHAAAHASPFPPQNMQQYPPQGYYATPPTTEPPFLQYGGSFNSLAPPQSSPTPGSYSMTAFHSGRIPQSSGFVSSTQQSPVRQSFTPASNNIQNREPATNTKSAEQPYVLPADQYLSWHELEHHYGPSRASYTSPELHASARLVWIQTIKMNIPPFDRPWVAEYKKQEAEDTWAGLSTSKRQQVEMTALQYKYKANIPAPRREVPLDALPLSFMFLESQYFNIPERKLGNHSDTTRKRTTWLAELGLTDPVYHGPCTTIEQQISLGKAYNKLPVVKRRAIEAKAKFSNIKLNPPKPMFKAFEAQYSIYKRDDCPNKADHKAKRDTWLRAIGLYQEPFLLYPYTTTEFGVTQEENTEVAWSELGSERRAELIGKAEQHLKTRTWGGTWGNIEKNIGFRPSDGERYTQWLTAIGMGRALKAGETRDAIWANKSDKDREAIWRLAVVQKKEIQDRWDAKERAMMGGNRETKRKRTGKQVMEDNGRKYKWMFQRKSKPHTTTRGKVKNYIPK
ncbi:hypothetical protein VTL71DRAFT_12094 [Oculimacula yallundae]|uniref:Uncharacterized protein n=1 Tax=Oculimacula yallundae TaxID=86028 RepID=A0ABR4CUC2_9HELO